jgi:hypothetical protein
MGVMAGFHPLDRDPGAGLVYRFMGHPDLIWTTDFRSNNPHDKLPLRPRMFYKRNTRE